MSWIVMEYRCSSCGERFESFEPRSAPAEFLPHPLCDGSRAERVLSAPSIKTCYATAVTTAKSDGPMGPGTTDTRPLADGMPYSQWKKMRAKVHRDRRRAFVRSQI